VARRKSILFGDEQLFAGLPATPRCKMLASRGAQGIAGDFPAHRSTEMKRRTSAPKCRPALRQPREASDPA
jgi:hypothetical protein